MFTPLGKPRKLPFPLYNQVTNENEVSVEGLIPNPIQWPTDSEERVPVILFVSLNEWNAIASSVDVGADIAYPEQYVEVWWILTRNLAYAMPICALIIDCLMNDEDTKAALVDTLASSPEFQQLVKETAIRATSPQIESLIVASECDKDTVCGQIVAIVERLHTNNVDFLEIVEVGTNDEERVASLLSAIPGLGESPADEIIDFAQGILSDFSENYNAAVTEGWKDDVEEDLFCLAMSRDDCTLTYQDIYEYFQQRAGSNLTLSSLITNIVQFVINGDFGTDDLIASGLFAVQLAFITSARDFVGLSIPTIGAITRDASPSSKWEDFDECPTTWEHTWTADEMFGVWTLNVGEQVSGVGFRSTGTGTYPYTVDVSIGPTWAGATLTQAVIAVTSTTADGDAFRGIYFPSGGGTTQNGYEMSTGDYDMTFNFDDISPAVISIQVSNNVTPPGVNTIRSITLRGNGDDPFA